MSELVGHARQLSPPAQETLRLRAVAALVAGRTREDAAAVFQASRTAVDNWWAKWLAGGREALVAQPRGRRAGEHQDLDEAEQQAIRQTVLDHRPCDPGPAGQLWTRTGVGDLIAKLYRVRLTEQEVGKYLRRWGPSFQRPDKRAVEHDPEPVRVWHEETWPAIRAKAKAEGGEVLFADQVGIRSDQVTGRARDAKGRTPIVRRTGNRFSVNTMSAISTKGRMHFMVLTETFDTDVTCRFLDRGAGHFDRKVHLVVDGHSAHRSRTVRAWLAEHPTGSNCTFLPSYSPEPNPDELVNADLKHSLPTHSRARDQAQLAAGTRRFFHPHQRQPHLIRGCFGGPHVRCTLEQNPLSPGSTDDVFTSHARIRSEARATPAWQGPDGLATAGGNATPPLQTVEAAFDHRAACRTAHRKPAGAPPRPPRRSRSRTRSAPPGTVRPTPRHLSQARMTLKPQPLPPSTPTDRTRAPPRAGAPYRLPHGGEPGAAAGVPAREVLPPVTVKASRRPKAPQAR